MASYKHRENRRPKFLQPEYKVINWPEYNEALRRHGDITIWFIEETIEQWHLVKTGARGQPIVYSTTPFSLLVRHPNTIGYAWSHGGNVFWAFREANQDLRPTGSTAKYTNPEVIATRIRLAAQHV